MSQTTGPLIAIDSGIGRRLVSALVLMPVSLLFVFAGGWQLALLAAVLGLVMSWELCRLVAPRHSLVLTAGFGLPIATAIVLTLLNRPAAAICVAGLGGLFGSALVYWLGVRRHAVLTGVWLALICGAALGLTSLRLGGAGGWVVAWLFLLVWAADTAAFLVGANAGRRMLCPVISPDKTWEGLAAAVVAAATVGVLIAPQLPGLSAASAAFLGSGLAVAAQMGDLAESALKRRLGVKDMSGLIPGHGGVLDRLDSLLPVLIIAAIGKSAWSV